MSRFAKVLMLVALTLQGFMPAMAMHAMAQESVVEAGMKAHHDHGASEASHQQAQMQPQSRWHCPLLQGDCSMAVCIVCTALLPLLTVEQERPHIPGTPAPGLMAAMADTGLQPLVPPPRV